MGSDFPRPFEEGDLLVRLYYRPMDHRARIYCRSLRPNRSRRETCLPLTLLTVKRETSNLIFTLTRDGKPLDRWLTLRFVSFESRSCLVEFTGWLLSLPPEQDWLYFSARFSL